MATRSPRKLSATTITSAASAKAASPECACGPGTAAAAANSAEAASAAGTSRRCAHQAETTSAASGGATSAANSRCAVPSPSAPETTASRVPPAATNADRRNQGPGASSAPHWCVSLRETPPQVAQRPRARHVGDAVEIVRRRRRGRVPLQRVGEPRIVTRADALAEDVRPPDVDQEDERRQRHHAGPDRRDEVVAPPRAHPGGTCRSAAPSRAARACAAAGR